MVDETLFSQLCWYRGAIDKEITNVFPADYRQIPDVFWSLQGTCPVQPVHTVLRTVGDVNHQRATILANKHDQIHDFGRLRGHTRGRAMMPNP